MFKRSPIHKIKHARQCLASAKGLRDADEPFHHRGKKYFTITIEVFTRRRAQILFTSLYSWSGSSDTSDISDHQIWPKRLTSH